MAISGQTFYNFILDNLRYFATFKAMGANNRLLTKMVLLQAVWVGFIGWGLGIVLGSTAAIPVAWAHRLEARMLVGEQRLQGLAAGRNSKTDLAELRP